MSIPPNPGIRDGRPDDAQERSTWSDIIETVVHWHAGQSINKIAASLSVERKIVRKRIVPTQSTGMVLGEGGPEQRVVGCGGPRVVPRAG